MARDKTLVSDDERDNALIEIVEFAKDIDIKLWKRNWSLNYVQRRNKDNPREFNIVLAKPIVKNVEYFTALNHECCHLLFDSPIQDAMDIFNTWVNEIPAYEKEYRNFAGHTYKWFWNLLEDQRIESQGGKIWEGTRNRFIKTRKKLGEARMKDMDNDKVLEASPTDVILLQRFLQGHMVVDNKYAPIMAKALEDVEFTGRYGALLVLKDIKKIIDLWMLDCKMEGEKQDMANPPDSVGLPQNGVGIWNESSKMSKKGKAWWSKEWQRFDSIERLRVKGTDDLMDRVDTLDRVKGIVSGSDEEIKDKIKDSKEEGGLDLDNLREAIKTYDIVKVDNDKSIQIGNRMKKHDNNIDKNIYNGLKLLFKSIAEKPKVRITSEGNEVDIESFIERKIIRKDLTRCLRDIKKEKGASLLISIDGSASMNNGNMDKARKLVRTIFSATRNIDNINIKAQVWSSNSLGKVYVTNINNMEETDMITTEVIEEGFWNLTPTHKAVTLASKTAKHMKGEKKLIIMITDGVPNYAKNNFTIPRATVDKMTKNSFTKALRITPNFMCILLGREHPYTNKTMKYIFGERRFMRVDNFDDASERIIKNFKQLVMRTLK